MFSGVWGVVLLSVCPSLCWYVWAGAFLRVRWTVEGNSVCGVPGPSRVCPRRRLGSKAAQGRGRGRGGGVDGPAAQGGREDGPHLGPW